MNDTALTLGITGFDFIPVTRKPAELLALPGYTGFSGYFRTQKLLAEIPMQINLMCVCEGFLYFSIYPGRRENTGSARNTADFWVSGLVGISKFATGTLGVIATCS